MSAPDVTCAAHLPDLRLWLAGQWREGGTFERTAAVMLTKESPTPWMPHRVYSEYERISIETATLWWVSADMVDVMLAAAPSMPLDVKQADLPIPSNCGLVVFEKPWTGIDAKDPVNRVTVDAIMWGRTVYPPDKRHPSDLDGVRGLGFSAYRRLDFGDGLAGSELIQAYATGALTLGETRHEKHTPVGTTSVVTGRAWMPLGRSDWPESDALGVKPWDLSDETMASFVEDRSIAAALWTLLRQKSLVRTTTRPADRPARRRSQRAGIDPRVADVRVITLRSPERTESTSPPDVETTTGRTFHHRWIVQPHFVWQPYGPRHSLRKLIVRGPYQKGPADAPLHTPKVVRSWVR